MTMLQPLRASVTALATTALLMVAACASTTPQDAPTGEPLVRGPIQSVQHSATASGVLVAAGPDSREACGIQATADAATTYFRRGADGGLTAIGSGADGAASLVVGDTVEVYVDGPVAESCPVQGHADAFVLLP